MTTRESLHAMLDELPEELLGLAEQRLASVQWLSENPAVRASLEAPEDDEPLTRAEEEMLERSKDDFASGRWVTTEELRRLLESQ